MRSVILCNKRICMYVCIVSEGHSRTRHRTKITTDTLTAYRKSYWYQNEWPWPSFRSRYQGHCVTFDVEYLGNR